jgi:hypothetical protein
MGSCQKVFSVSVVALRTPRVFISVYHASLNSFGVHTNHYGGFIAIRLLGQVGAIAELARRSGAR